jgi:hypothetical protein
MYVTNRVDLIVGYPKSPKLKSRFLSCEKYTTGYWNMLSTCTSGGRLEQLGTLFEVQLQT